MSAAFMYIGTGSAVASLSLLYKVLSSRPKVFKLQLQVGELEEVVSIDRLKPHRGAVTVQPAQPDPSLPHPQGLVLVGGHVAEKIDE